MISFKSSLKEHFHSLCDDLLSDLNAGEEAVLNLDAEQTSFLRWNGNRVRQNTDVDQILFSLRLQKNQRTVEISRTLTGNREGDIQLLRSLLSQARSETAALPADPNQVAIADHGQSEKIHQGQVLSSTELIESISTPAKGLDLAGLYAGGPMFSGNRNSKGQSHWFATENFFMDYSLYSGEKAAKSVYASSHWNAADWKKNLGKTADQLEMLHRPLQSVKPGHYRTYLAPAATDELLSQMTYGALSTSIWKQGQNPFKKLADGEKRFSKLFSLRENFGLGLTPAFNSSGEVSDEKVSLIENGEFRQFLTSSRTAKEFGLPANGASELEYPRSPEILGGNLQEQDILKKLDRGLYLSNLHYLSWSDPASARVTGMTRYACFWVENGEIVGPIKDLRFDESLYEALGPNLIDLTSACEVSPAVMTYGARALGGRRTPGVLVGDWAFTL